MTGLVTLSLALIIGLFLSIWLLRSNRCPRTEGGNECRCTGDRWSSDYATGCSARRIFRILAYWGIGSTAIALLTTLAVAGFVI